MKLPRDLSGQEVAKLLARRMNVEELLSALGLQNRDTLSQRTRTISRDEGFLREIVWEHPSPLASTTTQGYLQYAEWSRHYRSIN